MFGGFFCCCLFCGVCVGGVVVFGSSGGGGVFGLGCLFGGGRGGNFYFIYFLSRDLRHPETGLSPASGRKEKLCKPVTRWWKQSTSSSTSLPAHGKTQLLAPSPGWNGVAQGEDKPCGSRGR